jgi:hypothetical protein
MLIAKILPQSPHYRCAYRDNGRVNGPLEKYALIVKFIGPWLPPLLVESFMGLRKVAKCLLSKL